MNKLYTSGGKILKKGNLLSCSCCDEGQYAVALGCIYCNKKGYQREYYLFEKNHFLMYPFEFDGLNKYWDSENQDFTFSSLRDPAGSEDSRGVYNKQVIVIWDRTKGPFGIYDPLLWGLKPNDWREYLEVTTKSNYQYYPERYHSTVLNCNRWVLLSPDREWVSQKEAIRIFNQYSDLMGKDCDVLYYPSVAPETFLWRACVFYTWNIVGEGLYHIHYGAFNYINSSLEAGLYYLPYHLPPACDFSIVQEKTGLPYPLAADRVLYDLHFADRGEPCSCKIYPEPDSTPDSEPDSVPDSIPDSVPDSIPDLPSNPDHDGPDDSSIVKPPPPPEFSGDICEEDIDEPDFPPIILPAGTAILLEEEMLHHIQNMSNFDSSTYDTNVKSHYTIRQSVILENDTNMSAITSPSLWSYLQYGSISYVDLGSEAHYHIKYDNPDFDSTIEDSFVTFRNPATPGLVREGLAGVSDPHFGSLMGGDPEYPFITPAGIAACADNIWPCMEHICGDRYGNQVWINPNAAQQNWNASDQLEKLVNGQASNLEFISDPVKKEFCRLSRLKLSYCYMYEGKRDYYFRDIYDNYVYRAMRHFKYVRRFTIIQPQGDL